MWSIMSCCTHEFIGETRRLNLRGRQDETNKGSTVCKCLKEVKEVKAF